MEAPGCPVVVETDLGRDVLEASAPLFVVAGFFDGDEPACSSRVVDAFVQALAMNARVTQTVMKRARQRVLSHPNALGALVGLALG